MRVVQVVLASAGGIGAHVRDLAEGLRRLGHDVVVATDAATEARLALLENDGDAGPGSLAVVVVGSSGQGLREVVRDADVVHAHGFRAGMAAVGAARPRGRGGQQGRRGRLEHRPVVISLHNTISGRRRSPRRLVGALAARLTLRRADLVTGASADLVELAARLGARRAELAEVPSPRVAALLTIDRDRWRTEERPGLLGAHGLDPQTPFVLAIGRVSPQKRIDVLAEAAACARQRGSEARWALLGPGQADLPGEVATSGLRLLGETDDVLSWVLAADVLVVTSEWEARALVVQEAMAAGTPVVVTAVGGLPSLVGGAGVLVPWEPDEGRAQRVATAVGDLLDDPVRRQRVQSAARAEAATWDGVEASAKGWAQRYAAVCPKPRDVT